MIRKTGTDPRSDHDHTKPAAGFVWSCESDRTQEHRVDSQGQWIAFGDSIWPWSAL